MPQGFRHREPRLSFCSVVYTMWPSGWPVPLCGVLSRTGQRRSGRMQRPHVPWIVDHDKKTRCLSVPFLNPANP